ncbi:hypothetical protein ACHAXA_006279 [Cyclostephanos tholiformis]|uniref:AB hydrolase-1 domain-containing protein n=1 Tax=Cyclostephanos tholiformis TaxID=382380 RepID=A0ABD3SNT0_9STRA
MIVAFSRRLRRSATSSNLPSLFATTTTPSSTAGIIIALARGGISLLLRTALLWRVVELIVQERYLRPRRVTTSHLAEGGRLPSALSGYAVVTPLSMTTDATAADVTAATATAVPIGVHSLRYARRGTTATAASANDDDDDDDDLDEKERRARRRHYDGISLHHGFGASSLSWLPILPRLVERYGRYAVAHDAPGFGFTDRPDGDACGGMGLYAYGSENSAGIGLALLREGLDSGLGGRGGASEDEASSTGGVVDDAYDAIGSGGGGGGASTTTTTRSIAIFGHSMGSRAALFAALKCSSDLDLCMRPELVVLVAPALAGLTLPSRARRRYSRRGSRDVAPSGRRDGRRRMGGIVRRIWLTWRRAFVDRPLRYGLRRLVCGSRDFWRKGLTLAWGDPSRLSDSDVLRFQWPSIGVGWEGGLINFSKSRILSYPTPRDSLEFMDDGRLFEEVARLNNTRIVIIYGSRDRVVRIDDGAANELRRKFPNVAVIKMEGCGHDPFEEDVSAFMSALEEALEG